MRRRHREVRHMCRQKGIQMEVRFESAPVNITESMAGSCC